MFHSVFCGTKMFAFTDVVACNYCLIALILHSFVFDGVERWLLMFFHLCRAIMHIQTPFGPLRGGWEKPTVYTAEVHLHSAKLLTVITADRVKRQQMQ